MLEQLVNLVPLLVIVTGVIASVFAYRQAERQKAPPPSPTTGLMAVGGMIASQETTRMQLEEIQKLTRAVEKLAEAYRQTVKVTQENSILWEEAVRNVSELRRATQDISHRMGERRAHERNDHGE